MSQNWHDLITSREMRHAYQLDYSVQMISDIATSYDQAVDRNAWLCARSMLEAFYVHLRLLGDFLVKTTNDRDFGPADFGLNWTVPSTVEAARLAEHWDTASKYVVHFGRPRVPEDLKDLRADFEIGNKAFQDMASDALVVYAEFLRRLEASTPAWTQDAYIPDQATEPDAWRTRNLADRTALLRDSFVKACAKVGLNSDRLLKQI